MNSLEEFKKLGLNENSLKAIKKKGFETPSPIQREIIPIMLTEKVDVIGQAQTGTGKTASFALPIIEQIKPKAGYIQVIILTPTRELAIQVSDEIYSLKDKQKVSVMPIYGGQSIDVQFRRLKKGIDIVVGTPGRILDHISRGTIDLSKISYFVLDEADEMLNMGFIDDIESIMKNTPDTKRVALFSATMPDRIKKLAKKYMKKTKIVTIKAEQLTTDLTEQIYYEIYEKDKFEALCRIIDIEDEFYGLIFCRTKVDVDNISNKLIERGYEAEGLHGDISQHQRNRILNKFKNKRTHILVATDVAARGLDITDLTHVINYSLPQDPESYVHRIGRTGRAGKKGIAITFITPSEYRKLAFIKRIAKTTITKKNIPEVKDIIKQKKQKIITDVKTILEDKQSKEFVKISKKLLDEYPAENIVSALLEKLFKNEIDESNYSDLKPLSISNSINKQGRTRLFIALGRNQGYTPKKLVEFIKKNHNISDRDINDVLLLNDFSFITVPFEDAETLIYLFKKEAKGNRPIISKAKERKKDDNREFRKKRNNNFKDRRNSRRSYNRNKY